MWSGACIFSLEICTSPFKCHNAILQKWRVILPTMQCSLPYMVKIDCHFEIVLCLKTEVVHSRLSHRDVNHFAVRNVFAIFITEFTCFSFLVPMHPVALFKIGCMPTCISDS